ncbi:hypothetical protein MBLNU459_g1635t2 [Dothideomycetes sp. NU459]
MFFCSLLLAVWVSAGFGQASTLYNGAQTVVLSAGMSQSCNAAFNTSLNCPANDIQLVTYGMYSVGWNTTQLQGLCTPACNASLGQLASAVQSGCTTEFFNFNSANMTYTDVVDHIRYKVGLICLADATTSNYCLDVENTWNISTLVSQGKATWPNNTSKCYYDYTDGDTDPVLDVDGLCFNPSDYTGPVNASQYPQPPSMAGMDFFTNRTAPIDDGNYGWSAELGADEYPLEIQCSSCFFEMTEQIWANMKANCKLSQQITPANNITGRFNTLNATTPTTIPDYSQIINITVQQTCAQIALAYQIPYASLEAMNTVVCGAVANGTSLYAPNSCPIAIVNQTQSMSMVLQLYNNFTQIQFLQWNPYIDTGFLGKGQTVCVGPPGGAYVPSLAVPASPSIYTTTAKAAAPTVSGTIPNCGLYYLVQSDYNPEIDSACSNLWAGYDYCVGPVNGTYVANVTSTLAPSHASTSSSLSSTGSSSTKSSTATTTSKPTSSASTTVKSSSSSSSGAYPAPPSPTVSGTTSQCKTWYTVVSGDTCSAIDTKYSISLAQFSAWNTGVNSGCTNLQVGYSYCVSGPAVTSSVTSVASKTSSAATTATTPSPTQTGMVANCKKFYQADMQCVANCDSPDPDRRKNFEQPVLQTLQMFIGEAGCWLVVLGSFLYRRYVSPSLTTPAQDIAYEPVNGEDGSEVVRHRHEGTYDEGFEPPADPTNIVAKPFADAEMEESERIPLAGWRVILLALPACCDIAGTTLMNVGLLFVAASIYQMTRGALVLFVGLFSVVFLKKHLGGWKWASLFVVVLGVAVVGLAGALDRKHAVIPGDSGDGTKDLKHMVFRATVLAVRDITGDVAITAKEHTPAETILGMVLIAGAQVFTASQFVIEESIMSKYALDPLVTVGWEGTFGFLVTLIGMGILHGIVGITDAGQGGYFDAREGFSEFFNNRAIAVSSVLIMISIGGFNFFGLSVTRTVSATARSTIDTCRTLFIWMVSLGLGWETFKWLQVLGFALLVYGTMVFNEIIRPPTVSFLRKRIALDDSIRRPRAASEERQ